MSDTQKEKDLKKKLQKVKWTPLRIIVAIIIGILVLSVIGLIIKDAAGFIIWIIILCILIAALGTFLGVKKN